MKLLAKFIKAFSLIFFPLPSRWYTSKDNKPPLENNSPPPTSSYPERKEEAGFFSIFSNPPPSAPNFLRVFSFFFEGFRELILSDGETILILSFTFLLP